MNPLMVMQEVEWQRLLHETQMRGLQKLEWELKSRSIWCKSQWIFLWASLPHQDNLPSWRRGIQVWCYHLFSDGSCVSKKENIILKLVLDMCLPWILISLKINRIPQIPRNHFQTSWYLKKAFFPYMSQYFLSRTVCWYCLNHSKL